MLYQKYLENLEKIGYYPYAQQPMPVPQKPSLLKRVGGTVATLAGLGLARKAFKASGNPDTTIGAATQYAKTKLKAANTAAKTKLDSLNKAASLEEPMRAAIRNIVNDL